jgi:hypothetical protein
MTATTTLPSGRKSPRRHTKKKKRRVLSWSVDESSQGLRRAVAEAIACLLVVEPSIKITVDSSSK